VAAEVVEGEDDSNHVGEAGEVNRGAEGAVSTEAEEAEGEAGAGAEAEEVAMRSPRPLRNWIVRWTTTS